MAAVAVMVQMQCCGIRLRLLPGVRARSVDLWKDAAGESAGALRGTVSWATRMPHLLFKGDSRETRSFNGPRSQRNTRESRSICSLGFH